MQHTLGPWLYQPTAGNHAFLVYDEKTGRDLTLVRDFNEANARLIAAAPDLLAALKDLLGDAPRNDERGLCVHCGRDNKGHEKERCDDECPGQIALDAISKATGESCP